MARSYAVELTFDPIGEATVQVLRSALHGVGVPPSPRQLDARPHVSLAVLEADDPEALLVEVASFARTLPPLTLAFAAVGSFAGDGRVLYLAPSPTGALLRRQHALAERLGALDGVALWNHYLPDAWTPHCTLGMEIDAALVAPAFAAVRAALTPFEVVAERLRLVAFPPLSTLESFALERDRDGGTL